VTLVIYALILAFTITRFHKMQRMEDPIVYEVEQDIDLLAEDTPKFRFANTHFTLGFQFTKTVPE
jgi:hypothetical protein